MYKCKSWQVGQLPWEHLSFLQNLLGFITKYFKQEVDDKLKVCLDERSPRGIFITGDMKIYQYHVMKVNDVLPLAALQIRASQWSITVNLWPLTAHIYYVMIILTIGFCNKSFLILFSEAAICRCSSKQVLLEILQYSQKNICVPVSF